MTTARADPYTHATAGRTLRVDPANMIVRAVVSTAAPDRAGEGQRHLVRQRPLDAATELLPRALETGMLGGLQGDWFG